MRISRRKLIQTGTFAGLERTQWLFREMFAEGQAQVGGLIPGRYVHTGHLSAQQIVAKDFRTAANVGETGGPAGIRFTASEIAGYSSGTTKQFYLQSSDGKAYFGGGSVVADANGLTIKGDLLIFEDGSDNDRGSIYADATNFYVVSEGVDMTLNSGAILHLVATSGIAINSTLANIDTKISGNNEANLIYADGSADKVGFGIVTPAERVHVLNGNLKVSGTGGTVKAVGYEIADGNAGADGSFTAGSGETVTVEKGIITSIV